jgi:hypothetical protein
MICGLAMKPGTTKVRKQCGLPSPYYWTPNAVCHASDYNYNMAPFSCSTTMPQSNQPYSALYQCSDSFTQSCYTQNASSQCCGCSNWQTIFPGQPFKACTNTANQLWTENALPGIEWAKRACPLAKTYAYDDASSLFSCHNVGADKMNVVNYTVTFCPQ